ncbi:hypothetical protein FF1_006848 [Malus domestica]|uniref:double-stranded RNA-binding protein 1-like isoform X1 n=1 Tax=Malus domestica TaxID=3750 RepID=UPI0010AA4CB9|nr:double-stranded RNA-binding protein 1-like isoform X1 [Malus domestica]XP_028944554.1 double-stranded RNA-binding protein 1-like isoform X1 [Malus domestica]
MYKSKLQEVCHGKQWGLPTYTAMKDGPDHNPCFRASVSVNGFSFDSPVACKSSKQAQNQAAMLAFFHFTSPPSSNLSSGAADPEVYNTLKEAERAAANTVLMSLSEDSSRINDEMGHYKNLLQELAREEGFCMPTYKTVKSGASHMPTFSSTVEVEGEQFCGKTGKSKKQAELSAAKVAYISLKKRGLSRSTKLSSPHVLESAIKTTQSSDLTIAVEPLENLIHEHQSVLSPAIKYEDRANETKEVLMDNMNKTGQSSSCSESIFPSTEESGPSQTFKKLKPPADVSISDTNGWKGGGLKSYLLCHRVRVYNQFPDISLPNHITVLPISDDKWVPFILEFPNEESN